MHRNLDATAAVLGLGPRKLRGKLRELGILTQTGDLASKYRGRGHLFVESKQRWNKRIGAWTHYGVVMTTEDGVTWLAKQLGISITTAANKDAAA